MIDNKAQAKAWLYQLLARVEMADDVQASLISKGPTATELFIIFEESRA